MISEQLFFEEERMSPVLPLDLTIPLATWVALTVRTRIAWYLADMLSAAADIQGLLASENAAHLQWIKRELNHVSRETGDILKGLAC